MNVLPRTSTAMEWNKRTYEDDLLPNSPSPKRPRYSYHLRLESESSITSEGEESVLTVQGQETELANDPSDTESRSDDDYDVIEYEVASLSESEAPFDGYLSTSSGCSNDVLPVVDIEDVVAAVLADSSLEAWAYDTEHSSTDEKEDSSNVDRKVDFRTCAQCRGQNDDPRFRLCTSCFQVRKKFYPPRPRRTRKHRTPELPTSSTSAVTAPPVNIEKLKSCLDGMTQDSGFKPSSQDSGLGSSQELPLLQLDKIVVPETAIEETRKRRRSQDDSDEFFTPKSSRKEREGAETESNEPLRSSLPEFREMCIVCNEKSKNSAFLHGNSAHACCCYRCAIQCWKTQKKCPICNRKVKNVVKLFTI